VTEELTDNMRSKNEGKSYVYFSFQRSGAGIAVVVSLSLHADEMSSSYGLSLSYKVSPSFLAYLSLLSSIIKCLLKPSRSLSTSCLYTSSSSKSPHYKLLRFYYRLQSSIYISTKNFKGTCVISSSILTILSNDL
jgi:hypothetical protein